MFCRVAVSICALLLAAAPAGAVMRLPSSDALTRGVAAQSAPTAQTSEGATADTDALPDRTFAVVPFTNTSGDDADNWIGDGIAETVASDLTAAGGAQIAGRSQVAAAMQGVAGMAIDAAGATRLGRRLRVRWVVSGGYQRVGQRLRITSRLVDARTGEIAGTSTTDGAVDAIFDLQDQIVSGLIDQVATATRAPERPALERAGNPSSASPAAAAVRAPERPALERAGNPNSASPAAAATRAPERPVPARAGNPNSASPAAAAGSSDVTDLRGAGAGLGLGRPARSARPPETAVTGSIVLPAEAPAGSAARAPERPAPERAGDPSSAPPAAAAARAPERPVPARAGNPNSASPAAAAAAGALAGRPFVTADFATEPPTVDGALDDALWRTATRITQFVQVAPVEGAPASEDTEVFVAFDSTHLYVGMYAHYSNPGMIRANRVDRDRAGYGDDTISVYFDTFLDQQRAFVFTLNGYGVQGDSLMGGSGGGRGGGGYRGGGGGVPRGDRSWDVLFDSAGTLVDDGWTAEMAIPFKSLRYPSNEAHRWGFQIARSIRDKDETVVWAPISRDVSGFLPQMGLLDGLRNLSTSRNFEILPTMTAIQAGSLNRSTGDMRGVFEDERQPEGGVNFKYGVTSNLTLDFTYNPDFSQIESDRPQIEVNQRFPLFFSELRPFFLEGQEVFSIRGPATLIHTRTIVDPRYGAKLTGKVGKATMGFLVANDEGPGNVDEKTDPEAYQRSASTVIGRARYDLYSESHIGAIFTDREFLDTYSRLGGVDGRFRLTPTISADFMAIQSTNRDRNGRERDGPMFDVGLRKSGRNLSYSASYYSLDPDFVTDVGFVRRTGIRRMSTNAGYRWWPEGWIISWGPQLSYSRNWNFDRVLEDEAFRARLDASFARNIRLSGDVRREMERFRGVDFFKSRYGFNVNVSTSRLASVGGSYRWGDEVRYSGTPFVGSGSSGSLFMSLRPLSRLQSQVNVSTSRLIRPDDTELFNVKIYRALTTFQFTDRLLLRNILEHNTFNETLGVNLLLTYRVNSGTVFYIGYDDRYRQGSLLFDDDDEPLFYTTDLERTNRAFFTKISYLFRY